MLSMVVTASGDFVLLPCTKKYVLRKQIRHGSVPDPDLEIRGGGGGGRSSRHLDKERAVSKRNFFRPSGLSLVEK